jgi:hypothetical protein
VVIFDDVWFLVEGEGTSCRLSTKTCEEGLKNEWVSDIPGASSNFDREAIATRIRLAATSPHSEIGPTTKMVADTPVTCLSLPNGKRADAYCFTAQGQLASIERIDATVTLTSLTNGVDPNAFTRPDR